MRTLYGLDLGNGTMNCISSEIDTPQTFSSMFGRIDDPSQIQLSSNNRLDNITMRLNEMDIAVGSMALKNCRIVTHDTTEDKYLSDATRILSDVAFSLCSTRALVTGGVVIGLPIHKMSIAKQVGELYKNRTFGGKLGFFGAYEDKIKRVNVDKVAIVTQPHGTLFSIILDDKGAIQDTQKASKGIAIYDIGFKTNDGIVFKSLETLGRLTIMSKNGMHVAFEAIKNRVSQRFNGLEVKLYEVPSLIASRAVRGVNIGDIIDEAFYELALNIIGEVRAKWEDAWEIEEIVFTGGGAELLKPYLMQAFQDSLFCGMTTNVEGNLKYAYRLWGENE